VRFKWTNTLPHENAIFWGLWDDGFNWDGLQRFIAGYQPPTKHCARQERDLRAFAKKAGYKIVGVWKEIAPGPKQERAETQEGPGIGAGPHGRLDPRHRTDPLGPLGHVHRAVLNVL